MESVSVVFTIFITPHTERHRLSLTFCYWDYGKQNKAMEQEFSTGLWGIDTNRTHVWCINLWGIYYKQYTAQKLL